MHRHESLLRTSTAVSQPPDSYVTATLLTDSCVTATLLTDSCVTATLLTDSCVTATLLTDSRFLGTRQLCHSHPVDRQQIPWDQTAVSQPPC